MRTWETSDWYSRKLGLGTIDVGIGCDKRCEENRHSAGASFANKGLENIKRKRRNFVKC